MVTDRNLLLCLSQSFVGFVNRFIPCSERVAWHDERLRELEDRMAALDGGPTGGQARQAAFDRLAIARAMAAQPLQALRPTPGSGGEFHAPMLHDD